MRRRSPVAPEPTSSRVDDAPDEPTTERRIAFLVQAGLVSAAQEHAVREQLRRNGGSVPTALVSLGLATDQAVAKAFAQHAGLPQVDLHVQSVDPAVAEAVGAGRARELDVLAFAGTGGRVRVAVADPTDTRLEPVLAELAGLGEVVLEVAPADELRTVVNQTFRNLVDVDHLVEEFARTDAQRTEADPVAAAPEDQRDVPVVQLVERIISQAAFDRASDVHIEPFDDRCRVRYRIDGALTEVLALPSRLAAPLVSRIKILADMSIVERRRPQDGQFTIDVGGRSLDVRVATSSTLWGEKAVLRLLGLDRHVLGLSDLGMDPGAEARFARLARSAHGMLICSGPTGSGKTTTLYSALGLIDSPDLNITTIEDPVESVLDGINQIQISEPAGLTFAVGLRSILRQDPDIILVGEMRDAETTRIAVEAALTGHLVLSSIHATDATAALVRMADMGIERFRIASSVIGVVGQRLVRQVCRSCAGPDHPSDEELGAFERLGGRTDVDFVAGRGCNLCGGTGHHGRTGVFEVLELDDDLRDLLVAGRPARELRAAAAAAGMHPIALGAAQLVAEGTTTVAEVLRKVSVH